MTNITQNRTTPAIGRAVTTNGTLEEIDTATGAARRRIEDETTTTQLDVDLNTTTNGVRRQTDPP